MFRKAKMVISCLVLLLLVVTQIDARFLQDGITKVNDSEKEIKLNTFEINLDKIHDKIENILSNINVWDYHRYWLEETEKQEADYFKKNYPWVKYVNFMTATGGNKQRDLFVDPSNKIVRNDYKIDSLVAACRNALRQGLKPYIKTGNVPLKYSSKVIIGENFGVNVYPPDDYQEYYKYIRAIVSALVKEFGNDEVKTWKWGVLTEYENKDWSSVEKDSQKTKESYFKLYDYTVAALQSLIGKEIYVGAHSMTVSNGLWDERDFIEHCANGKNYFNGEKGTRLCFLSCSFYDKQPGINGKRTLPEMIAVVRDKAKQVGLDNLEYGIDEGRILEGSDGKPLTSRITGKTYQAAYDARLFKTVLDNNINYFSTWGFTTNDILGGVPTVSYHIANLFSKMISSNRLDVDNNSKNNASHEVEAIAGYDSNNSKLYLLVYNYNNTLQSKKPEIVLLNIKTFGKLGNKVKITKLVVDDSSNYYDEWMLDCKKQGIDEKHFSWSNESTCIDPILFSDANDIKFFKSQEEKYKQAAGLKPVSYEQKLMNEYLKIPFSIEPNTVVFYEIKQVNDIKDKK
jgi:hypothetical protein